MDIKVDISIIEGAIKSKESLDALCLAIFFKARYVNSVVYYHSARETKAITHLGTEKYKRCLKAGLSLGYLTEDRGSILVGSFHRGSNRYVRFERNITFREILGKIRESVILNKANQIQFVKNIIDKASSKDGKLTRKEVAIYRKIRQDMDFTKVNMSGSIRKASLARLVNLSKSSISKILKKMESEGLISIEPSYVFVGKINGKTDLSLINQYRDSWFLTRRGDGLFYRTGNIYTPLVYVA